MARCCCCCCCKWLLIIIVSLIVIAAITLFGLSFFYCLNTKCLMTAFSLKLSRDPSVEPCEDFYNHVCGKWKVLEPTSLGVPFISQFLGRAVWDFNKMTKILVSGSSQPWAVEQARIFYKSCQNQAAMNENGLSPLYSLLQDVDLPKVPSAFFENSSEPILPNQLAKVKKHLGSSILFDTGVMTDPRNNEKYIFWFIAPQSNDTLKEDELTNLRRRLPFDKTKGSSIISMDSPEDERKKRIDFIKDVIFFVLGDYIDVEILKTVRMKRNYTQIAAERIYNLTKELHDMNVNHKKALEEVTDVNDDSYMDLSKFQNFTDSYVKSFNHVPMNLWQPYIETLLGSDYAKFNASSNVLVLYKDYFKKISLFMAQTPPKDLELLLWWNVVEFSIPFLSDSLKEIATKSAIPIDAASTQGSVAILTFFGFAMTRTVAEKSFIKDGKVNVEKMLENIKTSFSKMINESTWIDENTKSRIMQKKNNLGSFIGYPEWVFDDKALNKYYEGVNMSLNNPLYNVENLRTQSATQELKRLFQDHRDKTEFISPPTSLNAFYDPTTNSMEIPDAILHFPFYELGMEVLNYAAIGTIVGHEFSHAFDDTGRQFDEQGNLKDWWSNETISRYKEKAQCFVDQYEDYKLPGGQSVNGTISLGENIADNGGLIHGFNAYQLWKKANEPEKSLIFFGSYNQDQLFFLEYAHMWCSVYSDSGLEAQLADAHPPDFVRINSVLQNSEEFSKTWNCPAGSKMNPQKKCKIW